MTYKHFLVEVTAYIKCLLYIPKRQPFNMFHQTGKTNSNVKLYVKRVFITDDFKELIPI